MPEAPPVIFEVQTDLVNLRFVQPTNRGGTQHLSEAEVKELAKRQGAVALIFSRLFSATLADPTLLPFFNTLITNVGEMMKAELGDREGEEADKIREILGDGD